MKEKITIAERIKQLGLLPGTLEEIGFNEVAAVVHDEFRRNHATIDYRHRAINRMAAMPMPIHNECNIATDLMRRYISLSCPYCNAVMKSQNGGGNGSISHIDFSCKCGARASIGIGHGDFTFRPKEVS